MFLVNIDESNNLKLLSEILDKLNNMKNIFDIYDKNMQIYTFTEMKKNYKMMLLENPQLKFEFIFKNKLTKLKLNEVSDKRHLVVIDFNLMSDLDKIIDQDLLNQNVHLIVLFNNYDSSVVDICKLDPKAIVINKKDN